MPESLVHRVREFFDRSEVPYGMAVVRIGLPLVVLLAALPRWFHIREIYSTDGAPAPVWLNYGFPSMLPEPSAPMAVALYSLMLLCLLTASLGWMTRVSLGIVAVLYPYFGMLDSIGTLTKYTVIGTHAFLLLALSGCGTIWSVDAWLSRRRARQDGDSLPTNSARCPLWPCRLLQLLMGVIYLGAAFTKMHTPAYFSGDQLVYWMLANVNLSNPVSEYLALRPSLLIVGAYATILWEILFIFLVWGGIGRVMMLGLGIGFHLMTGFTLGLIVFPLLCLAIYPAFTMEADFVRCQRWLNRLRGTLDMDSIFRLRAVHEGESAASPQWTAWIRPGYSLPGFALLVAVVMILSVEVEYRRDVYGERSGAGPQALQSINIQLAKSMLGSEQRLRPQDLYFSFDVGTSLVGGTLSDRRTTFRHGEQAVIQCCLTPPHPDMWLEVVVQDADHQTVQEVGQVVPREDLRTAFVYQFADLLRPGEYDFVLRYDGAEITRRRVTLVGEVAQVAVVP